MMYYELSPKGKLLVTYQVSRGHDGAGRVVDNYVGHGRVSDKAQHDSLCRALHSARATRYSVW